MKEGLVRKRLTINNKSRLVKRYLITQNKKKIIIKFDWHYHNGKEFLNQNPKTIIVIQNQIIIVYPKSKYKIWHKIVRWVKIV